MGSPVDQDHPFETRDCDLCTRRKEDVSKSLLTLPYDPCDSGYLKQMTIKQVQNDLYNTEALPTLPQETRFSRIRREQKNREKLDKTMFDENIKFLLLTCCTTYCCKIGLQEPLFLVKLSLKVLSKVYIILKHKGD